MGSDVKVLIGLTLIDACFIYAMIKNYGAGTELTLLTIGLTAVLAVVWPITILT
jgi:hypothetical protein